MFAAFVHIGGTGRCITVEKWCWIFDAEPGCDREAVCVPRFKVELVQWDDVASLSDGRTDFEVLMIVMDGFYVL
jgi:hypothetical protein